MSEKFLFGACASTIWFSIYSYFVNGPICLTRAEMALLILILFMLSSILYFVTLDRYIDFNNILITAIAIDTLMIAVFGLQVQVGILVMLLLIPSIWYINKKMIDTRLSLMCYEDGDTNNDFNIIPKSYMFYNFNEILVQQQIIANNPIIKAIYITKHGHIPSNINSQNIVAVKIRTKLTNKIISLVSTCPNIKYIYFIGYAVNKQKTISFASYLQNSKIKYCDILCDPTGFTSYNYIFKHGIAKMSMLKSLIISNTIYVDRYLLRDIFTLNNIQRLEISYRCSLGITEAKMIRDNKRLTHLRISGDMDDNMLRYIIQNTNLHVLLVPMVFNERVLKHNYQFAYVYDTAYGYGTRNWINYANREDKNQAIFDLL